MNLFRNPAFLAAVAMTVLVSLYFVFVADFAFAFLRAPEIAARILGGALLVLPTVGVWWLYHEWRLGITTQQMASQLEREGRLPIGGGETLPGGRLTEEAAEASFEAARRNAEINPEDWAAWFHVAHAYEDNRDRSMARKSMRHAADLYRAERKRARP
ncbi:hypothetical protein [Demequina sp. NBRC 110056]|uniref:hypothetical protein n=1 Tax=Demequina sp. NBRC 110056 TaxID=1570345 RepID=UPI0009FC459F|nr:hypothetical protein [Demequina sp. NBRC 110056]